MNLLLARMQTTLKNECKDFDRLLPNFGNNQLPVIIFVTARIDKNKFHSLKNCEMSESENTPAPSPLEVPPVEPAFWPSPTIEDFTDGSWPDLANQSNAEVEKWVFDNKTLHVRVLTWNLCAKPPPSPNDMTVCLLPKDRYGLYKCNVLITVEGFIAVPGVSVCLTGMSI
jgi:hypothetical protein